MKNQDFSTTIVVDETPEQVFDAINRPQDWWTGDVTGSASKLNDEFVYVYKELHVTRQKVDEMIPNRKVVWLVTESHLNYTQDKQEWAGTKIVFDIAAKEGKTQVRFTHVGLDPEVECFDSCSNAWTQLIREGLYSLITTGKGEEIFLG
ncbi:MAG: SRPBCC family protein [Mucilaginibacter sp.]